MKIGFDVRLWDETGVGRYIRNLVGELQKIDKSNEYVLFALGKDIEDISSRLRQGARFNIVPADIKWHTLKEQIEFPKILEKEKLDLVHFPYFSMPISYKGKYVLTIHDLIINHFPTGKASTRSFPIYYSKYLGYKYVLSKAIKNAEKIIAVSYSTEKEIIDHYKVNKNKVVVTYEGVDNGFTVQSPKSKVTNCQLPATNYFLYVGNAYPHKNLDRLVEVISDIQLLAKNLKLILVGKEDYFYKKLQGIVGTMGLRENILFKHNVNDEELSLLYKNALALIAPSLMEGFGLPLLEAMENNCLVIASDIPVFHEICEDAAVYMDPFDKKAMANVILSVYNKLVKNESDKKKLGKKRAEEFTWEKTAKQTLKVYESCLGV